MVWWNSGPNPTVNILIWWSSHWVWPAHLQVALGVVKNKLALGIWTPIQQMWASGEIAILTVGLPYVWFVGALWLFGICTWQWKVTVDYCPNGNNYSLCQVKYCQKIHVLQKTSQFDRFNHFWHEKIKCWSNMAIGKPVSGSTPQPVKWFFQQSQVPIHTHIHIGVGIWGGLLGQDFVAVK